MLDNNFPSKDTKRAERRRSKARMMNKAKRILSRNWYRGEPPYKAVARHADNLAICSCSMCANPRKEFKGKKKNSLTIHEISALHDERNMLICD